MLFWIDASFSFKFSIIFAPVYLANCAVCISTVTLPSSQLLYSYSPEN